ncbi:MAG: insulinase family protein [Acidobacteria bacterium]|nr:insulinase family protein [Acidobacteriota bacterium]
MQLIFRLLFYCCAGISLLANVRAAEDLDGIPIPEFHTHSLLNGMDVYVLPSAQPRVPFVLMVKNGAAFDPVGKWGLTYLTTRMMLEGSETHTGAELREDLQKWGAELDARVEMDAIFFYGTAPQAQLLNTLDLLAKIVIRPRFQQQILDTLKSRVREEIIEESRYPEGTTQDLFFSQLFKGNPYEHSVKGTEATLAAITLDDLLIQYRKLFLPNQSRLALYGSRDNAELIPELRRRWGAWVRAEPLPFTFRPPETSQPHRVILIDRPLEQSLLRWGMRSVTHGAQGYYALKIFEHYLRPLLPSWAMEVTTREQIAGWARLDSRKMPGFFQLSIKAAPEQLLAYLVKYQALLADIQAGRIDLQRFMEARRSAHEEYTESLKDPTSKLYRILETDLYDLGVSHIANYAFRLNRVSPETLQATLKQSLETGATLLVVAGPVEVIQPELEKSAAVEIHPYLH